MDYRFATVGPTEAASDQQWRLFVADPFGDGSVSWTQDVDGETYDAPGVSIYRFLDDDGRIRYDVRLFGPRADDDIAAQFRTLGASGTRLTQRVRPTYDQDGNQTGTEVYESGTLTTRQWRDILLITGEGDELERDEQGQPTGRPSSWPGALIEHTWL
jgi:hypothetical protein